jgi:hypothetical protein
MEKIIDGKRYNTKTAIEVGYWCNGLGNSDFRNCDETLYRTKNGNYFLYGEGGGLTRWAKSNGNTSWGSSGVVAMPPADALAWFEQHDLEPEKVCVEILALITEA